MWQPRCRVDDCSLCPDDLREPVVGPAQAACFAQTRVGLFDEGGDIRRPRAQALIDRAVERRPETNVEKEARRCEDSRHRERERERQPDSDRQTAQRTSSFRSR
ncbi:MAG: hypothetical protein MSC30_17400 [Gaiellaceae bacterium MAG52_C11]|nr:hypothetical protein [Candidatus Gaiellasilicea maunaloa]